MDENIKGKRLQKVLQQAKQDTAKKDVLSFAFAGFFSTFLALLAPFFTNNNTNRINK